MNRQLSLFDDENEPYRSTMKPPGDDYPWRFHEIRQRYMANGVHPAIASVMADEDVRAEEKAVAEAAAALPNLSRWERSTARRRRRTIAS